MPTNLLLAPVGAGKTEIALERLATAVQQADPFARIWVLLPSQRQQGAFRQRLAAREPRAYFNIQFFNFYSLYAYLLDAARQPQRRLEETARLALLRSILTRLQNEGQLEVFGRIAHTPGFVRIVADFIYELKQNVIYPEKFELEAQSGKDHDLARIYSAYQLTLQQHNLVDREGEGWLALSLVENEPTIGKDVKFLLVDGYDQFTSLQAQLLTVLASRAPETLVTLTTVPWREQTIGRRFEQASRRLREAHFSQGVMFYPDTLFGSSQALETRHTALRHLAENGFLPEAVQRPAEGAVQFIEAPDPGQEVAAVLRRVKRLLLSGSVPDDILIALRDWERYSAHLAVHGRAYNLPLTVHYGENLTENPAIVALMSLLSLHTTDFRRRDLLDTLRSPYFEALTSQHVDQLEHISQAFLVTGGRAAWLEAISQAARAFLDDDDEHIRLFEPEESEQLHTHLAAFIDAVTPPEEATIADYVHWVEQLIGPDPIRDPDEPEENTETTDSLQVVRQIRAALDDRLRDRDLSAMACFKRVLRGLVAARELMKALEAADAPLTHVEFLNELRTAVQSAVVESHPNRAGRVLVTTVADARGLPHKHVFVLGLSEGLFPRQTAEDPLYLDTERQRLAAVGIPLETQAERADDDGLFYELICLPRDTLTLSRPSIQDGVPWPASHLWREALRVFNDIEVKSFRIGAVVPADEVASFNEAALAVADGLSQPETQPGVSGLYNWLVAAHRAHWSAIVQGRQIELERMSFHPHNHYSGRLRDPAVIAQVARILGPDKVWSASQFNDYGLCAFRFFATRLLKLDVVKEPDEGIDRAQYGTLNHVMLETVYRRVHDEGLTIEPEHVEHAVEILHDVADERLWNAPRRLGFRASALWRHEAHVILRKLEALIRMDFSGIGPLTRTFGDEPRRPYRLEIPFGADDHAALDVGGETLKVQGFIDRMDRQGNRVIIVDYKTGSTAIEVSEMEQGRNFQMMLYLLAAQQLLAQDTSPDAPTEVAGGLFWHIGTRKASGEILLDDAGVEAVNLARDHLARYLSLGRQGDFAARANKMKDGKCAHYCEFREMCRVSIMNRHKD